MAELCKIPPESIGVGMYQHDVDAKRLATAAEETVQDCVNSIGVNLNTARYLTSAFSPHSINCLLCTSVSLLKYVSGFDARRAENILHFRQHHGAYLSRQQIMEIDLIGRKTFQYSAGFLRVLNGSNPFDMTGIHPESYEKAQQLIGLLKSAGQTAQGELASLFQRVSHERLRFLLAINKARGDPAALKGLSDTLVLPQLEILDLMKEMEEAGADPRDKFDQVQGVSDAASLKVGQAVQGVVMNVLDFGAFVDIGTTQLSKLC